MSSSAPYILVDGTSYLHRAFHALPPLMAADGSPTGAIYGVASMLRRLVVEYAPEHMVVVFDAPGPTFRDEMYPQYKATRPPAPEDLAAQREPVKALVRAMGLPVLCVEGVEADDVLATVALEAERGGFDVIVATADKDLAQIVGPRIRLLDTMKNVVLDEAGVRSKFGVGPGQIVDYLALMGDTSDNIPGVAKCGPKTAAKWLAEYGTLEALCERASEIGGKIGERLRESLDHLPLSKQLVTIRTDCDLGVAAVELRRRAPEEAALSELVARLGFRNWRGLPGSEASPRPAPAQAQEAQAHTEIVLEATALRALAERLGRRRFFAVEVLTDGDDCMSAGIVGIALAETPQQRAYIPVGHTAMDAPAQLPCAEVLEVLRGVLEGPKHHLLGHRSKFTLNVLARHGIHLTAVEDVALAAYVLSPTAENGNLSTLASTHLNGRVRSERDVLGSGARRLGFQELGVEAASEYAAEVVTTVLRLQPVLSERLGQAKALREVYRKIEAPLLPVLAAMERRGVRVDAASLGEQSKALREAADALEARAWEVAGVHFNLGSPQQIQDVLYGRLGLPARHKTPKGQPSTAENVLAELAGEHELPGLILEHRGLRKLISTYTDRLPELIHPETGRVHTTYQQAVTSTGRLSSTDPNLQNIPIRSAQGRRIREAFVAAKGCRLIAADYSQVELRIMAHLSEDEALIRAFREGRDIHRATAAEVFGVGDALSVDEGQRRAAKAINFGLIYGMSEHGLARGLGIDRATARGYMARYFERYPGVRAYMDSTKESARERGFVETLFGRRLYLPEIRSRHPQRRQYAERTAINAPVQGTAADIIKRAMIRADALHGRFAGMGILMQVHDELVVEAPEACVEGVCAALRATMEGAAELVVPLVVDVGVGAHWGEAH